MFPPERSKATMRVNGSNPELTRHDAVHEAYQPLARDPVTTVDALRLSGCDRSAAFLASLHQIESKYRRPTSSRRNNIGDGLAIGRKAHI